MPNKGALRQTGRNEWMRRELENRTRLENEIRALGGQVPRERWPWDDTGELRNLQLSEMVEELREAKRLKEQKEKSK